MGWFLKNCRDLSKCEGHSKNENTTVSLIVMPSSRIDRISPKLYQLTRYITWVTESSGLITKSQIGCSIESANRVKPTLE